MIISEIPCRARSRGLQVSALLFAVVVLPLGMANAQDYEAVGKRLAVAVQAGELSGAQARIMLETLKKEATKKDQGAERAKNYLMNVRKEISAAVEAGKISEEDAKKKFAAAEQAVKEKMAAARGERDAKRMTAENLTQAGIKIRKLVADGKLSEEDARAKMAAMRKMVGDQGARAKRGGDSRPDWDSIKRRIEGAVKSGSMTREQADAKYKELKETLAKKRGGER